jgi:Ser/Thr protein kinase RdoA (MazF antagonist)
MGRCLAILHRALASFPHDRVSHRSWAVDTESTPRQPWPPSRRLRSPLAHARHATRWIGLCSCNWPSGAPGC